MTKMQNDIFYVCSLIEFLGRCTKNHRGDVVKCIGKSMIAHQLSCAEVNHCLSFEQVAEEIIEDTGLENGDYDSVGECRYTVPSVTAIGKVYMRLVCAVNRGEPFEETIYNVFSSFISDEISFFNSNVYYSTPDYLEYSYYNGEMLAV
ncbi:MAG: hypothetical protein ACI38A_08615 [Candidatus Ornithomonoglobus sp.]